MLKQPETLRDVITRVMDTLNSRRQKMCDFFDDFDDFIDDGFDDDESDDGMEDSVDFDSDDNLIQEDDQPDGFDWDQVYWSGVGLGFAYEEGRRKVRKRRKNSDSNDPSDID